MSFRSDSDERHLESPQTPSPTILPNRSTSEYKKEIQQQTAQSHSNVFSNAAVESQVPSTFSFGTESDLPRESIQLGTNSNLSSLPFRPAMTTRTYFCIAQANNGFLIFSALSNHHFNIRVPMRLLSTPPVATNLMASPPVAVKRATKRRPKIW
jgi:hypothetical protein